MRPVPPGLLTVNVPPENSRGSDLNASSRNPGYGLHGPNSIRTQRFIRARHTSAVKLVTEDNVAEKKIIAVLGATGAQGGGLVRAIMNDSNGGFTARALTRDVNGARAKELAKLGAEVVAADVDDAGSLKKAFNGCGGQGYGPPARHMVHTRRHAEVGASPR